MNKFLLLIIMFFGLFFNLNGQRANVFAAFQLIENEKYEEAKKAVEEALKDSKTKDMSRSWYAKGLLCQRAYEKGIKDNNSKLYELYPDQLFVSYESFENSLRYKRNTRITDQLEPIYVSLANNFMVLGEKEYRAKNFTEAFRAYESALKINESYIVTVELDTNLVYNTALAAYKSEQYDKALELLNRLNRMNYSSNVPHLLYSVQIELEDTLHAELALREGIQLYDRNEELVLVLVDLLYKSGKFQEAVAVLDSAILKDPGNYIFPYTKGLIYQKNENYSRAIEAYKKALEVDPEKLSSLTGIATCYFNIGVEMEQSARKINDNRQYRQEIARSASARKSAVKWFERALEKDPGNELVKEQLRLLYRSLHMTEKISSLDP